jgi:hypothetical protein
MRILIALAVALVLPGCALFHSMSNPLNTTTLYDLEAGYYTAQQIALAYKALPLCKTGTQPSVSNICAKRSVIVSIQVNARRAQAAITQLRDFVKNNPTLNAAALISATQLAISGFESAVNASATPGGIVQ